jgi:uncharacterized protein
MNKEQILKMKEECLFPDTCKNSEFTETHISWIVLTDHFAFKIKRPVDLDFLDFSTLEKRKLFCHREAELNKRLAPDMYMGVVPITRSLSVEKKPCEGKEIIEYAVQMKRMDNEKEMHKMLQKKQVTQSHLDKLAKTIARFHQNTSIAKNAFDTAGMIKEYAGIINELNNDTKNELLPESYTNTVSQCFEKAKNYLNDHRSYFNERIINDFQRDCHGDLNATNIFLYDDPVIFDCIEFSDKFRFIDVLNDIAFLCVDLDFYDHPEGADSFYRSYLQFAAMKEDENSRKLFSFYKSYRANIRAKVTLISLKEHPDDKQKLEDAKKYINLMSKYVGQL